MKPNLDKAAERKVLAEGMALEAVVGQDAAQVGVAGKVDAEQIPDLALVPVGRAEHGHGRRQRRQLVRVRLDAAAGVVGQRQQVVNHLAVSQAQVLM